MPCLGRAGRSAHFNLPQTRWLRPPRRGRWVTDRGSGHRSGFPCSAPGRPVQDGPCADHTCSSPVRSGRVGTESGRALSKRLPSREDDGCECLGHCHPWAVGQRVCPDRRKYRDHSEGRRASRSGDKRGHRDARDAPQLGARHGSAQAVPPTAQAGASTPHLGLQSPHCVGHTQPQRPSPRPSAPGPRLRTHSSCGHRPPGSCPGPQTPALCPWDPRVLGAPAAPITAPPLRVLTAGA